MRKSQITFPLILYSVIVLKSTFLKIKSALGATSFPIRLHNNATPSLDQSITSMR